MVWIMNFGCMKYCLVWKLLKCVWRMLINCLVGWWRCWKVVNWMSWWCLFRWWCVLFCVIWWSVVRVKKSWIRCNWWFFMCWKGWSFFMFIWLVWKKGFCCIRVVLMKIILMRSGGWFMLVLFVFRRNWFLCCVKNVVSMVNWCVWSWVVFCWSCCRMIWFGNRSVKWLVLKNGCRKGKVIWWIWKWWWW